jgi:hypothetical protein
MLSYTLAPAASCDYQDNTYTLGNGTLEEYVDASGQIIRYYEKTEQPTSSRNIFSLSSAQASGDSDTKELLRLLGLRESFVDELSQEQLAMYANARSISSITTYSVSDQNGNVMIIPEEIAIRNTSSSAKAPPTFPEDFGDGYGDLDSEFGQYGDSYMSITYLVAELGNGRYNHSVNATWLDEPMCKHRDIIGATVENNLIISSSLAGWLKYDNFSYETGKTTRETEVFSTDNFRLQNQNGWYGAGAIFQLPKDRTYIFWDSNGMPTLIYLNAYKKFELHFQFESTVQNSSQSSTFDSTASYDHATLINDKKDMTLFSANGKTYVGLNMANINVDRRRVDLPNELTYTP